MDSSGSSSLTNCRNLGNSSQISGFGLMWKVEEKGISRVQGWLFSDSEIPNRGGTPSLWKQKGAVGAGQSSSCLPPAKISWQGRE